MGGAWRRLRLLGVRQERCGDAASRALGGDVQLGGALLLATAHCPRSRDNDLPASAARSFSRRQLAGSGHGESRGPQPDGLHAGREVLEREAVLPLQLRVRQVRRSGGEDMHVPGIHLGRSRCSVRPPDLPHLLADGMRAPGPGGAGHAPPRLRPPAAQGRQGHAEQVAGGLPIATLVGVPRQAGHLREWFERRPRILQPGFRAAFPCSTSALAHNDAGLLGWHIPACSLCGCGGTCLGAPCRPRRPGVAGLLWGHACATATGPCAHGGHAARRQLGVGCRGGRDGGQAGDGRHEPLLRVPGDLGAGVGQPPADDASFARGPGLQVYLPRHHHVRGHQQGCHPLGRLLRRYHAGLQLSRPRGLCHLAQQGWLHVFRRPVGLARQPGSGRDGAPRVFPRPRLRRQPLGLDGLGLDGRGLRGQLHVGLEVEWLAGGPVSWGNSAARQRARGGVRARGRQHCGGPSGQDQSDP
mmetsp:Transcript_49681/g.132948  ORF Transcript_49681/g.132948 Transcript_49681/m.132948 type:complete len:470 (-) Transcript_49681:112-1521(-)